MKNLFKIKALMAGLVLIFCFYACIKDLNPGNGPNSGKKVNVNQVNLVSDTAGYGAARIDTNLLNAWGIAAPPNGPLWISANHKGLSVVYDRTGQTLRPPVTIPSIAAGQTGAPTGVIFNSTTDFGGNKFIFASEDGIIAAWSSGNSAVTVADRSASNAVYKGIVMATDGGANFLYLTNFKGGKIDVFDKNFTYNTSKPFLDPSIPAGFAPFGIQNIGGMLYVTYAKQKGPANMDDQKGPGNGYIDIFTPNGTLVKRFASQGHLNSPWGIALAPAGFADDKQTILTGNFGDGRVNIFDMQGNFEGQLQNDGQPLTIDGLWAIDFLENNAGGNANDPLFFTAGPAEESHGLLGYLKKK
jgi:uncharacterized protein (TIGR03118 family)